MNSQDEGRAAEARARAHLESHGYRFLAANHRTRWGEVDLIMEKGETIVFVEVRLRRNAAFGRPAETVNPSKQRKVAMAALDFVKIHRLEKRSLRFDIVSIDSAEITHLENAFAPAAGNYTL